MATIIQLRDGTVLQLDAAPRRTDRGNVFVVGNRWVKSRKAFAKRRYGCEVEPDSFVRVILAYTNPGQPVFVRI